MGKKSFWKLGGILKDHLIHLLLLQMNKVRPREIKEFDQRYKLVSYKGKIGNQVSWPFLGPSEILTDVKLGQSNSWKGPLALVSSGSELPIKMNHNLRFKTWTGLSLFLFLSDLNFARSLDCTFIISYLK